MAKDTKESIDYQKELKDLYDTKITDRQIDTAKQKQKEITPVPAPATAPPPKKFAKGGSASARADGCAIRGKTRA